MCDARNLILSCCALGSVLLSAGASRAQHTAGAPTQLANRPPEFVDFIEEEHVRAGRDVYLHIRAADPDLDPITITLGGVPQGATVKWNDEEQRREDSRQPVARYWAPDISWSPKESQCGAYEIPVTVTDGHSSVIRTVRIEVEEEWETFLMPGAVYSTWFPVAHSEYGVLHGPAFELMIAGWIHRTRNHGPSHVRIYTGLGLLTPTQETSHKAVQMNLGFDLSIERNPLRRALIPFYGLETGFFVQNEFGKPGYFTPLLGVHVWSDRNLFINLTGGYIFPTHHVDQLRGYLGKLSINFSAW